MTLAFDEYGAGDPLVLIHGLGTNRGVWAEAAAHLSRERRVIAVDVPGFGGSPPAGEGFELSDVAAAVTAEAEERIGAGYDLLGHSLGGAVALTAAALRPDLVRRLILGAPAGFRPRSERLAEAVSLAAPPLLAARRRFGRRLVATPAGRRTLLWGALLDGGRLSPDRAQAMLDASAGAHRLRDATRSALLADLTGQLTELDTPVGFLWGEQDPLMPRSTQEALRRIRPEAPVEVVPEAGHVAQLERPKVFADAVERLLERIGDPITAS
jgi:pimeloyl-ACP methyl ester carboxylesterase